MAKKGTLAYHATRAIEGTKKRRHGSKGKTRVTEFHDMKEGSDIDGYRERLRRICR